MLITMIYGVLHVNIGRFRAIGDSKLSHGLSKVYPLPSCPLSPGTGSKQTLITLLRYIVVR